jgi:small nuclear ribonucleoprotein B and B'
MNSRQSKFLSWINYRVRVIIQDSRQLVGTLLAFDKHMNLVLADTEEFTRYKSKKDEGGVDKERKRGLGLVLLRGENIISFSAESPPTENVDLFNDVIKNTDEGKSIPMGRGMPVPIDFNPLMGLGGPNGMMNINPGNIPGILPGQGGRGMMPVNSINMNMVMGRGNMPNQNNMPQMNMPGMNSLSNNNMGSIPQGISGQLKMNPPNFNGGNNISNINQGGIPNPMMNNMMRPPNMMPQGGMMMPMMNQNQLNNKQPQQNNNNTQQP